MSTSGNAPGASGASVASVSAEARALMANARQLGVALLPGAASQLFALLDELSQWNRAYNLTAIRERGAMVRAHLLDSLAAVPDLAGERILDVGTGAGFPGLPLAMASPGRHFTLIDSVAKKIRFVTHACRRLALTNVNAVQARVQSLAPTLAFDTIVARAYAPLPALLTDVQHLVGPDTRIVALKGHYPHEELAALPAGWQLEQVRTPEIPGLDATRHILTLVYTPVVPPRQRLD